MTEELRSLSAAPRNPFADDVLGRLIASNQDYQRAHGDYIVPLAERLLAARRALRRRVEDCCCADDDGGCCVWCAEDAELLGIANG